MDYNVKSILGIKEPNIDQRYYRFFAVTNYLYLLVSIGHFCFIFLFWFVIKQKDIALYNINSFIIFAGIYYINRRGNHNLALFICSVEIVIFTALCVTFIGWSSGFYYSLLTLIPLYFYNPTKQFHFKVGGVVILTAIYIGLHVYSKNIPPRQHLPQAISDFALYLNIPFAVITLCFFSYYYSRAADKMQNALEISLEKVEMANHKITDSLEYAKKIQKSLLPKAEEIEELFPHSFIIWLPKEIVSGDVYQTFKVNNGLLLALMDCTGHGVPGAFMTMLTTATLNKIVIDDGLRDPAQILNTLNSAIKIALKQDFNDTLSDDGLDAALCYIHPGSKQILFAGANMHLFYALNGETKMLKGNRVSLGYKTSSHNLTIENQILPIEKNIQLYFTTDGYLEQLGGHKTLPFGKKRFTELITRMHTLPFGKQKKHLLDNMENYRKDIDQLDDITIIGFKIS